MNYFFSLNSSSNSMLRGYEKRLKHLLLKEQTPRRVKEIKKLYKKIESQKQKIRKKEYDKIKRPKQQEV